MNAGLTRRLGHWRDVVVLLVRRDFKGRYQHTRVGIAWSVASPIMFLLIFYFLFRRVINLDIPRYASFVFTGIVVWNWTQAALIQAATSISGNQGLVNQPGFPIAALPVVAVASALVNLLIAIPLLLGLAWIEGAPPTITLIALPLVIAAQFVLVLALAYLIAAINVSLRDVEHILPILLQLGYYITPIFYSLANVPAEFLPAFEANPMTFLITTYRGVVMDGIWPDWTRLALTTAGSLGLLLVGMRVFERARYRFLEEL